jgi:hypothetical protein
MTEENVNSPVRYDDAHSTCWVTYQPKFYHLLIDKNGDSYLNEYLLQFLLVALMYSITGRGKYWKILFISALSGVLGMAFENITIAVLCREGNTTNHYRFVFTFLLDEIFWITSEFSIPFLNLIKMSVFASKRKEKIIRLLIYILFACFASVRIGIGYRRCSKGYLKDDITELLHGYAYAIMACADLVCSVSIIYFVNQYNKHCSMVQNNVGHSIKRSSYLIILVVDIVSLLLSVTFFLNKNEKFNSIIPPSIDSPFKYFKASFALILAVDALTFKFDVLSGSTALASAENNSRSYLSNNSKGNIKNYSLEMGSSSNINSFTSNNPNAQNVQNAQRQMKFKYINAKNSSSTYYDDTFADY